MHFNISRDNRPFHITFFHQCPQNEIIIIIIIIIMTIIIIMIIIIIIIIINKNKKKKKGVQRIQQFYFSSFLQFYFP